MLAFFVPSLAFLTVGLNRVLELRWPVAVFAALVTVLCLPGLWVAVGVAREAASFPR